MVERVHESTLSWQLGSMYREFSRGVKMYRVELVDCKDQLTYTE